MAIAFDAVNPDTFGTAADNVTSGAFTIAGSNRVLFGFMGAGAGTPATHSSMKRGGSGGVALTQHGSSLNIGSFARLSAWRLIAPAAASDTIYGNFSASQDEFAIAGVSYTGVDQTTPAGTSATNTGLITSSAGADCTCTITTAVGDVVLCCLWALDQAGSSPLATPNGTPAGTGRYEIEGSQLTYECMQVWEVTATGTSTTVSCNVSPTGGATINADWGIIAFVVNATGAGADILMSQIQL